MDHNSMLHMDEFYHYNIMRKKSIPEGYVQQDILLSKVKTTKSEQDVF